MSDAGRLYRVTWDEADDLTSTTGWMTRDEAWAVWNRIVATPGVLSPVIETSDPIFKQYVQTAPARDEGKEDPGHE